MVNLKRLVFLLTMIMMLALQTTLAWAKEPAKPEFTLKASVEKAKAQSKSLKIAGYDIERGSEVRDFASDKVLYTPIGPTENADFRSYYGLIQADLNLRMAERTYAAQEDSVVMQTYKAYDGLTQTMEKVKTAEAQVKSAKAQNMVAQVSYKVGIINKMSLIQEDTALASAEAGLQAARKSLDDEYQKFNQLVGLSPEDRPVLVDKPGYTELKVDDLNYEIAKALEQSPTIWLAQKKIDLAKVVLDLYNFADQTGTEPYDAKEIDISKAQISASDLKDQMKKLIRTLYYTVKQLEEQYTAAQENIKVNEEALRVMKIKFDVGMATKAEVIAAETSLAQAQQASYDLACQHEILSYAFQKPWAYAASAGN